MFGYLSGVSGEMLPVIHFYKQSGAVSKEETAPDCLAYLIGNADLFALCCLPGIILLFNLSLDGIQTGSLQSINILGQFNRRVNIPR